MLSTDRLYLLSPDEVSVESVLDFIVRNREIFRNYEPLREEEYFTFDFQRNLLEVKAMEFREKRGALFYIQLKGERKRVVGSVGLDNIVWGGFLSSFLGYKLDRDHWSRGYMTEAVGKIVEFAFSDLLLHRIEANVMPGNNASLKVLEKNGFKYEGLSKEYLKINGVWEDHCHMVRLNHLMR